MNSTTLKSPAQAAQGMRSLRDILAFALERGASDVHLKERRNPAIRVEGVFQFTDLPKVSHEEMLHFLHEFLKPEDVERFLATGDLDYALSMRELGRFRVNCYKQRGSIAIAFRHVKSKIPTFEELNLPVKAMERIASIPRGLVLITGTTSSGKSTTLAALLEKINQTRDGHIVTLENPIEYVFKDQRCSISQREVYIDTKDFQTGLRAVMREDPNVILIGEMRDVETFVACMAAAETGHLVFSTLHTTNVAMTIERIIDLFPPDQHQQIRSQIAMLMRAIVSQRLLPMASGKGRVPAVEVMFNNPGIAQLIRDNEVRLIPNAIAAGQDEGMQTFNMSLTQLVRSGMITHETAMWASDNPDELNMNLQGIFLTRDRGGILKKPQHT